MFKNLLLSTGLCAFTVLSPCFATDSGAAGEEDTSVHRTCQTSAKAEVLYNILHNDIFKWSHTYPVLKDLWTWWAHDELVEDESGTPISVTKAAINHFMDTPHIDATERPSILILKTLLEYTISVCHEECSKKDYDPAYFYLREALDPVWRDTFNIKRGNPLLPLVNPHGKYNMNIIGTNR